MNTLGKIVFACSLLIGVVARADGTYFGGAGDPKTHWVGYEVTVSKDSVHWTAYTLDAAKPEKIAIAPATFHPAGADRWTCVFDEITRAKNSTTAGLAKHDLKIISPPNGQSMQVQDGDETLTLAQLTPDEAKALKSGEIPPSAGQQDAANPEKMFRRMEAAFAKAKSIQCEFEVVGRACPGGTGKGMFALAEGNRCRLALTSTETGADKLQIGIVSDGAKLQHFEGTEITEESDVPKWFNSAMLAGFARAGAFLNYLTPLPIENKGTQIDDLFAIADFKLGESSKIGSKEARTIQYKLTTPGLESETGKQTFQVRVWIDLKSDLPLKRVVTARGNDIDFSLTETYTKIDLDKQPASATFRKLEAH
jgi:outer membrane lipoprotein-sorting protein